MVHIKDIDNLPPNIWQKELIKQTKCINCEAEYDPDRPIIFHECKTKMLWWHKLIPCKNNYAFHHLTYNGEVKTLSEWATILKIPASTLRKRKSRGWSTNEILKTRVQKRRK